MKYKELISITEPVFKKLYNELLTEEEKLAIQGGGSGMEEKTNEPCIFLFFRKIDPMADSFILKWNNKKIDNVLIKAEKREAAVLC
jgi:hypothetical protein